MTKTFEEIFDYLKGLEVIDTHEHLPYCESAREKDTDVLKEYLTHYFNRDLISAGLGINDYEKVINNKLPLMDRWKLVEPYWEIARYTGYGRALDISVKALYGVEKIGRSTIEQLNQAFLESLEPGHFRKVLKEKSKIRINLLDSNLECDQSFFRSVYRLDNFIYPKNGAEIKEVERQSDIKICSLDDWLEACGVMLDKALKSGIALQCDITAFPGKSYSGMHVEDTLVIADQSLQDKLKLTYPKAWSRIKIRQEMMKNILRIKIKEDVLPLSDFISLKNIFLRKNQLIFTFKIIESQIIIFAYTEDYSRRIL